MQQKAKNKKQKTKSKKNKEAVYEENDMEEKRTFGQHVCNDLSGTRFDAEYNPRSIGRAVDRSVCNGCF